jgi:hypothetical protein
MEFIIYRDSWRRGGNGEENELTDKLGSTSLYEPAHKLQCCLGQIACQAGIPLEVLKDEGEPENIPGDYAEQAESAAIAYLDEESGMRNSSLANRCMPINDGRMEDGVRETRLSAEFAQDSPHTLKFVDGIAPWFQPAV